MCNDKQINEMKQEVNNLVNQVKEDVGNILIFDRLGGYYDRPRTSYTEAINAFGFEFLLVYVFEEDKIYLYDSQNGRDIMSCDVSGGGVVPLDEFMEACLSYFRLVHLADSVGYVSIL